MILASEPTANEVPSRWRVLSALWALSLASGTLLRAALLVTWPDPAHSLADPALALAIGFVLDAAVAVLVTLPLSALLLLSRAPLLDRPGFRRALLACAGFGAAFLSVTEWFFFDEFTSRFNHVAVDYLLYPTEVVGNVWESYPVVPIVLGLALAAFLVARPLARWASAAAPFPRRLRAFTGLLLSTAAAAGAITWAPERPFGKRLTDSAAQNGLVELVRAYWTSDLDYDQYYATLAPEEAERLGSAEFGVSANGPELPPAKALGSAAEPARRDVLVVLEESLGSEYVGALGGRRAWTPELDRWAKEGLLLTNLIATGNRTVRGMESVLCSFPPLPPDSIVKRDQTEGIASLASFLARAGYRCEFFYGGDGAFDRMERFALEAGFDAFDDDGLVGGNAYPDDAFRTAWGVADEFVFARLLERQRQAEAAHEPFFATVLTVSNHRPFLVPGEAAVRPSAWHVLGFVASGAVLLGLSGVILRRFRRAVGALPLSIALLCAWIGYAAYGASELHADSTREAGVRYADRALGAYLDAAREAGILEHTVVLVVGDHGARVYGSEDMPLESYRIPALFLCPDPERAGQRIDRLASQIDLAPTLLDLANVAGEGPFLGEDLLEEPRIEGRAWVQHNRDIGLLTDRYLVVLGLQRTVTCYRRPDRERMEFELLPGEAPSADAELRAGVERAVAAYQYADRLYRSRRYRLDGGSHAP